MEGVGEVRSRRESGVLQELRKGGPTRDLGRVAEEGGRTG